MDTKEKNYTLYYLIPWPDSQKWLECTQQIEDGDIILPQNQPNAVLVAKDMYEFSEVNNGL